MIFSRPRLCLPLTLVTLMWVAAPSNAAAPLTVNAQEASEAVIVDGKLDEAVWQAGEWSTGFTDLYDTASAASPQTRFKVAVDDEFLYLAAVADEPTPDAVVAQATEHDGAVYNDDAIELMIDRTGRRAEYFHFVFNSKSAVYDAYRDQGGRVTTAAWNSSAKSTALVEADQWTLEVAIPLSDLALTAESVHAWAINVARNRVAGGGSLSSFAPMLNSFHQPEKFATLALPGRDVTRHFWTADLLPGSRMVAEDGQRFLQARIDVGNDTGRLAFATLHAQVMRGDQTVAEFERVVGMDAGIRQTYELPIPIKPEETHGRAQLVLRFLDRNGTALTRRHWPVSIAYAPLTLTLEQPVYRNSIYATQDLQQATGTIAINLSQSELASVTLSVHLMADDDQPITSQQIEARSGNNTFALDVAELAVGDYRIVAELTGGIAAHSGEVSIPLHKLPAFAGEVRLDENRVTLVDGKPFLPYGWFSINPKEKRGMEGARGINVRQDYDTYYRTEEQLQAELDATHAAGMYAVFPPLPERRMVNEEVYRQPLSDEDAQKIREYVLRWRDHPALLAWYMGDEVEGAGARVERLEAIYRLVAETDPYHPCVMLNNTVDGMFRFGNTADILMPDPYPLYLIDGHAQRPLEYMLQFLTSIPQIGDGRRATWLTPQGFDYGEFAQANNRPPTFEDLRNQNWLGVIYGTTGFIWYSYAHAQHLPTMIEGVAYLAKESQALQQVILAPQTHQHIAYAPDDPKLHHSYRQVDGHRYLIVASTSTEPIEATFTMPDGAVTEWVVVAEDRTTILSEGLLRDTFAPHAVHIYTDNPAYRNAPSLDEARRMIEAGVESFLATGDVALRLAGASAAASSHQYVHYPYRSISGTTDSLPWKPDAETDSSPWLEIDLGQTRSLVRLEVEGRYLAGGQIESGLNGAWTPLATLDQSSVQEITVEPTKATHIRFTFPAAASGGTTLQVDEVRVYEK